MRKIPALAAPALLSVIKLHPMGIFRVLVLFLGGAIVGGVSLLGAPDPGLTPNPNVNIPPPLGADIVNDLRTNFRDRETLTTRKVDGQGQRPRGKAKDIRFKMLIRRKDDPSMSADYDWATKPRLKGLAPQVVYPSELLGKKQSGTATVRFRINYTGQVDLSMVLEATQPEFGRAAQAAIETMTFTPPKKKDGSPALVLCDADFNFLPDGSGDVLVAQATRDCLIALEKNPNALTPANDLDSPLKILVSPTPSYPTNLARSGQPGSATVEFVVDEDGWVTLPRVVRATHEEFGYAAMQAVSLWGFAPPKKKGRQVATRTQIEIEFKPPAASHS